MQPIIVVNNEYITIRYLPDKKIIYHTIHKPIGPQLLIEAMDAGEVVMRQNGACKWLSDDRKNGPLSPELIPTSKNWGADMVAAGWKYWADVVPNDIVAAGTLRPLIDTLFELGLRMMVFTNVEDAFQWLEMMKG